MERLKLPCYFALAFVCCWPAAVLGDEPSFSLTHPEGKLTLTAEPCKAHVWLQKWQVAKWYWKGQQYEACWRMQGDAHGQRFVVVVDSAGDVSTFSPQQFTKDEAI